VATERTTNGGVPVDALLAALRRAAEDDGVDDVDAVVAEFATFVRAQAPRLVSQRPRRSSHLSWSGSLLAAGAMATAAFGAVASGLVANPFLGGTSSTSTASASGSGADTVEPSFGATAPSDAPADAPTWAGSSPIASGSSSAAAADVEIVWSDAPSTAYTDPDALELVAEQRLASLAPTVEPTVTSDPLADPVTDPLPDPLGAPIADPVTDPLVDPAAVIDPAGADPTTDTADPDPATTDPTADTAPTTTLVDATTPLDEPGGAP
jgi:molecular chaperone DnaK